MGAQLMKYAGSKYYQSMESGKSYILVKMTNCTVLLVFIFKHVLNLLHF